MNEDEVCEYCGKLDSEHVVRPEYIKKIERLSHCNVTHDKEWLKKQAFDSVPDSETDPNSEQPVYFKKDVELHLKFLKVQEKKKINQLKDLIGSQIKYTNDSNYCDVNNAFNNCLDLIEKVFLK